MKKFKLTIVLTCIVISFLGLANLSTDNSLFSSLKQLELINIAQAESILLGDVTVSPNKGNPDARPCTYWTQSYTTGVSGSTTGASINGGVTWTQQMGTLVICPNNTEIYCDYIGCH